MPTKLRPGILSSSVIRNSESRNPLKTSVADFIDSLSTQYDAISTLHSTVDPEMTKTGHALRVKSAVVKAMDSNFKRAVKLSGQLADFEKNLLFKAQENAGLFKQFPEAHLSELRSALRQMSSKDREAAIKAAFDSNDVAVIRAINEASSPVLVGSHTLPVSQMLEIYVKKHNPDLERELDEARELYDRIELVSEAFGESVTSFRDEDLELQAEKNQKATKEAMAVLDPLGR